MMISYSLQYLTLSYCACQKSSLPKYSSIFSENGNVAVCDISMPIAEPTVVNINSVTPKTDKSFRGLKVMQKQCMKLPRKNKFNALVEEY
jgi:hypothetical protein